MAHRPRLGPCALRSPGGDALMSKLATHGGTPVRTTPFPSVGDASGRTVGPEEEALVREVLSSGRLNRGAGPKVAELESCPGRATRSLILLSNTCQVRSDGRFSNVQLSTDTRELHTFDVHRERLAFPC